MKKHFQGLAGLAAIVLATTSCALLPGGGGTSPVRQFEQIVQKAGNNEVVAFRASRIRGEWVVALTVQPPGQEPRDWAVDYPDQEVGVHAVYGAGRQMTGADFETRFTGLETQMLAHCDSGTVQWELAPSGAEQSWVSCMAEGGQNEYVPGSARLDGQPVLDQFAATDPADLTRAFELVGALFNDGKATEFSVAPESLGRSLHFEGTATTMWDGSICTQSLVLSGSRAESPLRVGCETLPGGDQPFDLTTFDPELLASIRDQAAVAAGVPVSEILDIKHISHDGINLYVEIGYGNAQFLNTTIAPR